MTEQTQPTDAELMPCPFCGEAAKHSFNDFYGDMSMACCKSCGAQAYAPKWNRRAVLAKWGTPAGATEEVENLRKALVYAAFALHCTPQYMLAQGITLIDGDTVRVSRDGWTVEASVNPHRQPAPATQQPEGDVVAYLDVGVGGYLDLGSELSEDALQQLPKGRHALVIAGTYGIDGYVAAPQPSPTAQAADSVPAVEREQERIAFKDAHRHLDLDEMPDAWGRPMFKHSHVEASWLGWIARASHGQASSQAGEYPALVCDYCGALTPDPWHSSGMLHGKMSKHIHSCDACAARGAAKAQATAAQAVVQDDLITIHKPTTSAEMLWLLKLAHLVISDVDKTLEETFAPAQPAGETSRFGSPELQAMIIARCVEKDQTDSVQEDAARLDFLVAHRAYVVSDEDCCDGYWLHYVKPDGATWVQMSDHATPRAAIDAAMTDAARAAQKEGEKP